MEKLNYFTVNTPSFLSEHKEAFFGSWFNYQHSLEEYTLGFVTIWGLIMLIASIKYIDEMIIGLSKAGFIKPELNTKGFRVLCFIIATISIMIWSGVIGYLLLWVNSVVLAETLATLTSIIFWVYMFYLWKTKG